MFVFSIADSGYRYTGQAGEIYTNPEIYTKIPENFQRLRRRNQQFQHVKTYQNPYYSPKWMHWLFRLVVIIQKSPTSRTQSTMSDSWICVGIWVDGKEVKLASDIHTMLEQSVVNSAQSVVDKVSDEMESWILATGTNVKPTNVIENICKRSSCQDHG